MISRKSQSASLSYVNRRENESRRTIAASAASATIDLDI